MSLSVRTVGEILALFSVKKYSSGDVQILSLLTIPINEERGEDFTAVYFGESGDSGYVRAGEHRTSIVRKDTGNAFAKDLAELSRAWMLLPRNLGFCNFLRMRTLPSSSHQHGAFSLLFLSI